ncbi:MAG: hypothetical protein ABJM22_05945 [Balneola sp.]
MKKEVLLYLLIFAFSTGTIFAQSYNDEKKKQLDYIKPGTTNFLMRGYSHAGFEYFDGNNSFISGTFAPILLWQQGEKILFESELEVEFEGDGVQFALEYANISYILNDYATLRVGNFLTPFGAFNDRLHPAWINKLSTAPLGMGHDPVGPTSEFGAELRGASSIGEAKMNYSLYLSNGAILEVHDEDTLKPPSTSINGLNFVDNNNEKAIGGRLGFLPFNNSALEVGLSAQYTSDISDRDSEYDGIASLNYAVDLSYVKNSISAIKGSIDLKAQWNQVNIDEFGIVLPDGDELIIKQENSAYYAQLAYRPSLSKSTFLSNLEFIGRYSGIDLTEPSEHDEGVEPVAMRNKNKILQIQNLITPEAGEEEGHQEADRTQWSFGVNYWISWRSAIKLSYQVTDNDIESISGVYIHYALGF